MENNEIFIDKKDNNYNSDISMEIENKNINEFKINTYNFKEEEVYLENEINKFNLDYPIKDVKNFENVILLIKRWN